MESTESLVWSLEPEEAYKQLKFAVGSPPPSESPNLVKPSCLSYTTLTPEVGFNYRPLAHFSVADALG